MNIRTQELIADINNIFYKSRIEWFSHTRAWIKQQTPVWEYNKFGIAATGIFIQVLVAGIMIGLLGLAGGSLWIAGIGVFFAFMANSIAFAQVQALWIVSALIASLVVNITIAFYYAAVLLFSI